MKAGESTHAELRHCRFGGFVLDSRTRELRRIEGGPVALTAKAFDVLCVLVQERDRVVGRDELFARVWPGRVVEENTLTQAVSALRHALGAEERYVVTVPGRGYRFVADVVEGEPPAHASAAPEEPVHARRPPAAARGRHRIATVAGIAAALALLATLAGWMLRVPEPAAPAPQATPAAPLPAPAAAPGTAPSTVVVLPFRALAAGPGQDEWLGLGLAATLGNRIGEASALRVYPATSGTRFAGIATDPLETARRLGVDYLVEGDTRRDGDRIQVDVRLLAAADGRTLWSDRFVAPADRVFAPPARITDGLFAALAVKAAARLHRSPCDGEDAEAWRAYLRGQYQMGRPSAERARKAVAEFQRALERDPTCARAYAGLAYAYRSLAVVADADPEVVFPLATAAVERALELDPDLAEAYVARGWIQLWYDWDWPASEASFRRAIELDPALAEAHFGYANLLVHVGRRAEAIAPLRQALALDPLSPLFNALGGWALAGTAQAGDHVGRALELDPDYFLALVLRGVRRIGEGDASGGLADLQRARVLCGDCGHAMTTLGKSQADLGHRDAARAILREMEARDAAGYWPASSLATLRNALGDSDAALDLLERAWRERDTRMSFLLMDRQYRWGNLQGEPRFLALMERMRLPVADAPARPDAPAAGVPSGPASPAPDAAARTRTPASPTRSAADRSTR